MFLYGCILVLYYAHYAINFDENTFYFTSYIVIIFFFISLYVHYVVIKTKNIIFLVNNKINFATAFTTPGSWKLHIFISMPLLLRSLQRDSDKKIFWHSLLLFFLLHPRLLLPSPCHDQDNYFYYIYASWSKRKIINLVCTFTTLRP